MLKLIIMPNNPFKNYFPHAYSLVYYTGRDIMVTLTSNPKDFLTRKE